MDVNIYSDSAWNSASFGIIFKSAKNVHKFFLEATIAPLWPKRLKCCLYLAVFTIITPFDSKINSIFAIRIKSCIDSIFFWVKNVFSKNRPGGDLSEYFGKKGPEGDHRSIFRKKIISIERIWINATFYPDSKYAVYFAIKWSYNGKNCQI